LATLYVRDFPDALHTRVKELATAGQRSVSAEVIVLIDRALEHEELRDRRMRALRRIARRRRGATPRPGAADTLTMLSEDRAR